MASHDGASSSVSSFTHDVFLSFRGPDTGNSFTAFLHDYLKKEGLDVYMDREDLRAGEEIKSALFKAIQGSKISIPVFSKGYADSRWCLDELVEIVRCHRDNRQIILPVFFDVDPTDVRNQTGSFKASFVKHKGNFDKQTRNSWKEALKEVANISGYDLGQVTGDQSKSMDFFVERVLFESNGKRLDDVKNHVGLDAHVKEVEDRLCIASHDVQIVGIWGKGGIGKTTIAKTLYNRINFFYRSCFLTIINGEEASVPKGLIHLQEQLIYSISKGKFDGNIENIDSGRQLIIEKLRGKRVFLIFDDIDSPLQLYALAIESRWFSPGSRIVITSRDKYILELAIFDEDKIYCPKDLDDEQSLRLFSLHAFSTDRPPEEYLQLSLDVIHLAGGLPLTLEVLGSTFSYKNNREKNVWKSMLQEPKKNPHDDVYKKLKISYDNLQVHEKSIFLDAACFFVGWRKETLISIWDACGFNPILAIRRLTQMSLLKFGTSDYGGNNDVLWMHNQIQAMGMRIVYEESLTEPSKRSRIWSHEEILEANEELEGAQMLEVIHTSGIIHRKNFAMMSKLRILYVAAVESNGQCPHLPPNLRWLTWKGLIVPANFYHKKLVHMDLSRSEIREAWTNKPQNENERFQNLKVLNLQYCDVSHESLDFSWFPYLETLDLRNCRNMVNVHKSIGDLKSLVQLYLRETEIEELPNSICNLSSLKVLDLNMCSSLKNLPESIGDLKSLVNLNLGCTKIEALPTSICRLSSLKALDLNECLSLKNLPESIGNLKSLVNLKLREMEIEELPNSICSLSSLKVLDLNMCSSLKNLPESIGDLKSLVNLNLGCTKIEELPNSICRLSSLKALDLNECLSLKNLPESIGNLKSLVNLNLRYTKIEELPSSICSLSSLKVLNLNACLSLKNLPESIGDLKSLVNLDLGGTKIEELPNSICSLSSLEVLTLQWCSSLKNLPESIEDLKSLLKLDLGGTSIEEIPSSICKLNKAKIEEVSDGVWSLEKLEELTLKYCHNLVKLSISWERMRCLRIIDLRGTRILLPRDDSVILLSLVELRIGNNLESSLPSWVSGLPQLRHLELEGCTKLESISNLPSTLTSLTIVDCLALQTFSDLSSLKHLSSLSLFGCEELKEIRGFEGTESLKDLWVINCKTLTNSGRWKIHGQGTLLVDQSQRIDNYSLMNVSDGIDKGLILCVVFDLQNVQDYVEEGQLVDISLSVSVNICRLKKHGRIRCLNEVVIEGVAYTARKRDIIYVHHFKGFDWFGIPLEPGFNAIEVLYVVGNIRSSKGKEIRPIEYKVKFWKVLLESTVSEQQQQITNREEESITTTAKRMVADFFNWSDDLDDFFNWSDDSFNWSDDEDHGRSHHFVPTQQVGSSTHRTIYHFTSSSNALEIERSNPFVPQQADEESNNELIDSHNDLRLGLTDQGGGQAGRVAEDPNLSQPALGLSPERLSRADKRARLDMDDAGPSGAY